MKIIYELSWLWETLGIALAAAAVCVACAVLIGKAMKKKISSHWGCGVCWCCFGGYSDCSDADAALTKREAMIWAKEHIQLYSIA